jgi:hypothetical protein
MRGGRGAEAANILVADLDAIGFRDGADPWLPASGSTAVAAVAAVDDSHRLFLHEPGEEPLPLTGNAEAGKESADRRSALVRGPDGETPWCVREPHRHGAGVERSLVAVLLDGSLTVRTLLTTAEHLSTPRPSPDGAWLAWLQWPEAQMPWDGSELRVSRITGEGLTEVRTLLGGPVESVFQPDHARMISRTGTPEPHSKESGRELTGTRRVQLKNNRTAHLGIAADVPGPDRPCRVTARPVTAS